MASAQYLTPKPPPEPLPISSSSSSSSSSACKKRPSPHLPISDLLPPSPKRLAPCSISPDTSLPDYPHVSSSSSPSSPSSSSLDHRAFTASSIKFLDEELSRFDTSCLVELDESDPAMFYTQEELLSEMMKTLEKDLEDGNPLIPLATEGIKASSSCLSTTLPSHTSRAMKAAEALEASNCNLDGSPALSEARTTDCASSAQLPSNSGRNCKFDDDLADCLGSCIPCPMEIPVLATACSHAKSCDFSNPTQFACSNMSRSDDKNLASEIEQDHKEVCDVNGSTSPLSSASLSSTRCLKLTSELVDDSLSRSNFEHLVKVEPFVSREAYDELLRDLLAEASAGDDLVPVDPSSSPSFYDAAEHEIKPDEWPFFDCSGDANTDSSESDPHHQLGISFSYEEDEEAISRYTLFTPRETPLF